MAESQNPKRNIDCSLEDTDKDGDKLLARCEIINCRIIEMWQGREGGRIPFRLGTHSVGKADYENWIKCSDEASAYQAFINLIQSEISSSSVDSS